jgi:GNAT superfamily N-acetyltransferase
VMTDPERRRHGYGRTVMARAHEVIRSLEDCEFALLFASVMAVPFYKELGWRVVSGPVFCEQPTGVVDYTQLLPTAPVMVLTRSPGDPLPKSPIDVRGLPW